MYVHVYYKLCLTILPPVDVDIARPLLGHQVHPCQGQRKVPVKKRSPASDALKHHHAKAPEVDL